MEILKNHQFLRLWGNQVLLQVAFNMCNFSALLILAHRTHSPFIQSQFYAALTIPAVIFGLIAGPVVDMVERKTLMLVTDALLAILFFSYIFAGESIILILLIAFLTSSVARFFLPAEAATIPLLVDKKTLSHANSFFLFTLMGSLLLGFVIAGPVIQIFGGLGTEGEKAPFILASIFLIIGFILRLSLNKIEIKKPHLPAGSIIAKTIHLFMQTVDEVVSNHKISFPIVLLVFIELMMGILSVVLLEYVRRYLGLELTSISYILIGPLILGLILGVSVIGKIEKIYGRSKSIFVSLICVGIIIALLGGAPYIFSGLIIKGLAVLSSFVLGIFIVQIAVHARTILQINTKLNMQGRIFSFLDVMIALVTPIPVLFTGFFADQISLLMTLIFIGIGVVGSTYLAHKYILTK